jgi:hypothetical protein
MFAAFLLAAVLASSPWPKGVDLPPGQPIDEAYRREFDRCDQADRFRGHHAHGCRDDPNAVSALRRLPDGAIAYTAKLAVDLDGSPFACSPAHGAMDQCPTALMLPDAKGRDRPVDADAIPYVVIPEAGPRDVHGEFGRKTGVRVGDFGVVIARGRLVPVIVADTGPFAKLGEGSLALHRALGRELCARRGPDGVCRQVVDPMESIGGDVTTVIFPGSAHSDLTQATLAETVRRAGPALWSEARRAGFSGRQSRMTLDRQPPGVGATRGR